MLPLKRKHEEDEDKKCKLFKCVKMFQYFFETSPFSQLSSNGNISRDIRLKLLDVTSLAKPLCYPFQFQSEVVNSIYGHLSTSYELSKTNTRYILSHSELKKISFYPEEINLRYLDNTTRFPEIICHQFHDEFDRILNLKILEQFKEKHSDVPLNISPKGIQIVRSSQWHTTHSFGSHLKDVSNAQFCESNNNIIFLPVLSNANSEIFMNSTEFILRTTIPGNANICTGSIAINLTQQCINIMTNMHWIRVDPYFSKVIEMNPLLWEMIKCFSDVYCTMNLNMPSETTKCFFSFIPSAKAKDILEFDSLIKFRLPEHKSKFNIFVNSKYKEGGEQLFKVDVECTPEFSLLDVSDRMFEDGLKFKHNIGYSYKNVDIFEPCMRREHVQVNNLNSNISIYKLELLTENEILGSQLNKTHFMISNFIKEVIMATHHDILISTTRYFKSVSFSYENIDEEYTTQVSVTSEGRKLSETKISPMRKNHIFFCDFNNAQNQAINEFGLCDQHQNETILECEQESDISNYRIEIQSVTSRNTRTQPFLPKILKRPSEQVYNSILSPIKTNENFISKPDLLENLLITGKQPLRQNNKITDDNSFYAKTLNRKESEMEEDSKEPLKKIPNLNNRNCSEGSILDIEFKDMFICKVKRQATKFEFSNEEIGSYVEDKLTTDASRYLMTEDLPIHDLNSDENSRKDAAVQTDTSVKALEYCEKYSNLNDVLTSILPCIEAQKEFYKKEHCINNTKVDVKLPGSIDQVHLKERKLFLHESIESCKEYIETDSGTSKRKLFDQIPQDMIVDHEVPNFHTEYILKDMDIAGTENGIYCGEKKLKKTDLEWERRKVRMGLSRKQRVRPLHPYLRN